MRISDYSMEQILEAAGIELMRSGTKIVCRCPICKPGEPLGKGNHDAIVNPETLFCFAENRTAIRTEIIEHFNLWDKLNIKKWQDKEQDKERSGKMEKTAKTKITSMQEFKAKAQKQELAETEKPQRDYAREWKSLKPLSAIEIEYLKGRGLIDVNPELVKISNPGYLAFGYSDAAGNVVGYNIRGIYPDPEYGKKPTYKLLPKNITVAFNLAQALKSEKTDVYITEGEVDALSMLKMGYCVVASGGSTFLKPEIADIIKTAGKNPIFYADNDEAGRQAIDRLPEEYNYIAWKCTTETAKDYNDILVRGLDFKSITECLKTQPKPLPANQTLTYLVKSIKNKIIDTDDKKDVIILFSKWFQDWQFKDIASPVFVGLDINSEQIILFEKKAQKVIYLEKISSLQSLLSIDQSLTLKEAAIPPCKIEFSPENNKTLQFCDSLEKFKINTYKKSETRLIAEEYAAITKNKNDGKQLEYNIVESALKSKTPSVWAIISNLFYKDEERRYFINWLSYIAQTKKKTRNAVVIKGLQGTGKGLLFEKIIRPFFGNGAENAQDDSQVITLSNESLKSEFNSDLENQLFVAFNEVKPDFRDGTTIYEKLKQIISDDYIIVNQKFIKPRQVRNYANCIFFSNNSIPVSIENSDRRYSIFTANRSLDGIYSKSEIAKLVEIIENGECVKFWSILLCHNYVTSDALNTFINDEKEIIQQTTQEWTTTFTDLLVQKKHNKLIELISNQLIMSIPQAQHTDIAEDIIENLKDEMGHNYLSSNLAYSIYLAAIHGLIGDPEPEKINMMKVMSRVKFSIKLSAGLGKIKTIRTGSKTIKAWPL